MKYPSTRKKIETVYNKNETDNTVIGKISSSKDAVLRGLAQQKAPLSLIRKLQTRTLDEITFTAHRLEDYDFQDTFNGPNVPRTLPELGYAYQLQSLFYTVRLEKVPLDLIYSIKAVEFIEFGALQEYIRDDDFVYQPTGRLLEGEDLFNLPELASTVFREKPMFQVEEIKNSDLVNLTIIGSVVVDRTYLENWITEEEYINLFACEFMNNHKANISLYLGRSLYFK